MSEANEARFRLLQTAPLDSWIAISEDETEILAADRTPRCRMHWIGLDGKKTPPEWGALYIKVAYRCIPMNPANRRCMR